MPDERAAAFAALGLAQQRRLPVGLVCTSGTAALNYSPAVAEAYYQRVPLLIFTADRPPEWIDQQDGQTIRQENLYGSHCRGSFNLPVDLDHPRGELAHKGAVVGHKEQRLHLPQEVLFEPLDRGDVEVVGRLVQQQEVGIRQHEQRHLQSAALPAG